MRYSIAALLGSCVLASSEMETIWEQSTVWGAEVIPAGLGDYALTGFYSIREAVLDDNVPAKILYITQLLSGKLIDDRSLILFYTQIEKPEEPGSYESYTCLVTYAQDATYTDPVLGGSITVNNYDGNSSFMAGEEGVKDSIAQELNEEDKSEYDTWKIDTEDFTKYFYSKGN